MFFELYMLGDIAIQTNISSLTDHYICNYLILSSLASKGYLYKLV